MTRSTQLGGAIQNYETWAQKHAKEVIELAYAFPAKVHRIGTARQILYASDKWESEGDHHDYVHDFDSRPGVYARGGKGTPLDMRDVLGVEDLNGEVALPLLAHVRHLVIDTSSGSRTLRFGREPPAMCCNRKRKALVIFDDGGPLVICGGKMVITERGIVY